MDAAGGFRGAELPAVEHGIFVANADGELGAAWHDGKTQVNAVCSGPADPPRPGDRVARTLPVAVWDALAGTVALRAARKTTGEDGRSGAEGLTVAHWDTSAGGVHLDRVHHLRGPLGGAVTVASRLIGWDDDGLTIGAAAKVTGDGTPAAGRGVLNWTTATVAVDGAPQPRTEKVRIVSLNDSTGDRTLLEWTSAFRTSAASGAPDVEQVPVVRLRDAGGRTVVATTVDGTVELGADAAGADAAPGRPLVTIADGVLTIHGRRAGDAATMRSARAATTADADARWVESIPPLPPLSAAAFAAMDEPARGQYEPVDVYECRVPTTLASMVDAETFHALPPAAGAAYAPKTLYVERRWVPAHAFERLPAEGQRRYRPPSTHADAGAVYRSRLLTSEEYGALPELLRAGYVACHRHACRHNRHEVYDPATFARVVPADRRPGFVRRVAYAPAVADEVYHTFAAEERTRWMRAVDEPVDGARARLHSNADQQPLPRSVRVRRDAGAEPRAVRPWLVPVRPADVLAVRGRVALERGPPTVAFEGDAEPTASPLCIVFTRSGAGETGEFAALAHALPVGAGADRVYGLEVHLPSFCASAGVKLWSRRLAWVSREGRWAGRAQNE
jgi:hypothetical protein